MRAGANSLLQILTLESASVLKNAVADACRRGHAQVTPLHVAATLLSTRESLLREACLRTRPAHSSPLPQCRALELCFNIAVERLQSAQCSLPDGQPTYSNALVTALKRAQAHQRRGCPEQQQQPLLAVKVELEQLVMSILDDPSVSRVMREAGFISTDVKNHIEDVVRSMTPQPTSSAIPAADQQSRTSVLDGMNIRLGGGFLPAVNIPFPFPFPRPLPTFNQLPRDRNEALLPLQPCPALATWPLVYANSPLSKPVGSGGGVGDRVAAATTVAGIARESSRVLDVFLQKKRRNPLLVGEALANVDAVMHDVINRLERGDVSDQLKGVKVLSLKLNPMSVLSTNREELKLKFMQLDGSVQELRKGGAIIHLGELQWLLQLRRSSVISPSTPLEFCAVTFAVQEISELLARHHKTGNGRLWLMGSATNHTFYGLQSQHSSLENEWELQLVPITPITRLNVCENKICENGIKSVDSPLSLTLRPSLATPSEVILLDEEDISDVKGMRCSSDCMFNYEKEDLSVRDQEREATESPPCSSSVETLNMDGAATSTFQSALPVWLQNAILNSTANKPACEDHPTSLCTDSRIQPMQSRQISPLFPPALSDNSSLRRMDAGMASFLQSGAAKHMLFSAFKERIQDPTGCSPAELHLQQQLAHVEEARCLHVRRDDELCVTGKALDVEALARLCKGLAERVGLQKSVISVVANTIMQCRSGQSKRRWAGFKGDAWLLLLGPDKAGKQKMAEALAELIFGCEKNPVCLRLGQISRGLGPVLSRGKMPLDSVADAVRQNHSSLVLMLEDIEQLDLVCKLALVKAMERGRLQDSSGREVSLNRAIVLLTSSIGVEQSPISRCDVYRGDLEEQHSWEGEALLISGKRRGNFMCSSHKKISLMGRGMSLDLNLSIEESEEDMSPPESTAIAEKTKENATNEEQMLLAARTHLKEFYDLVDAAVVLSPATAAVGGDVS